MDAPRRMSPLTALFLGISGVIGVGILSGAVIAVAALCVVDNKVGTALSLIGHTIDNLPELIEALPPALEEILSDQRSPEYASNIEVKADFVPSERGNGLRPVMTVKNQGSEVVSLLTVRLAALDDRGRPIREWNETVATPIAIDDDWRGPLLPGATRYVVVSSWPSLSSQWEGKVQTAIELAGIRLAKPRKEPSKLHNEARATEVDMEQTASAATLP